MNVPKVICLCLLLTLSVPMKSQGRKMPHFTFQEGSLAFADANRTYSWDGGFTESDTLTDEAILLSLIRILELNPELIIEAGGHTSMDEDTLLGLERAMLIRKRLVEKGIEGDRIAVKNYAHSAPLLEDAIILSLPSTVEQGAANQRNRRVEINVVGRLTE